MHAFTLTRTTRPFGRHYPIQDAEIIACNGPAAELYGYGSPDNMVGKFLGETQTSAERYRGRKAFALRNMGFDIPENYCTALQRPGGEIVWVRKKKVETDMRQLGETVYLTRLEKIREATDDLPDLTRFDISDEQIRERIGWTICEARAPAVQDLLRCTNNVRTLLSRYTDLLSSVNGPLFSWSSDNDHAMKRITCPFCGFIRFCALTTSFPKCRQCRRQPGRKHANRSSPKSRRP